MSLSPRTSSPWKKSFLSVHCCDGEPGSLGQMSLQEPIWHRDPGICSSGSTGTITREQGPMPTVLQGDAKNKIIRELASKCQSLLLCSCDHFCLLPRPSKCTFLHVLHWTSGVSVDNGFSRPRASAHIVFYTTAHGHTNVMAFPAHSYWIRCYPTRGLRSGRSSFLGPGWLSTQLPSRSRLRDTEAVGFPDKLLTPLRAGPGSLFCAWLAGWGSACTHLCSVCNKPHTQLSEQHLLRIGCENTPGEKGDYNIPKYKHREDFKTLFPHLSFLFFFLVKFHYTDTIYIKHSDDTNQ